MQNSYQNANVIVDGMNIAHRCRHIYDKRQKLATEDGQPTGTIYGFARHVIKLRDRFPGSTIYVTWEGSNSIEERRSVCADYKANRKDKENDEEYADFFAQIEVLENLLEGMGIHQITVDGYEADDVMATLVRNRLDGETNIIVTSDRDMLQLVDDQTVLMTPSPERFFDTDKVIEEYGVTPDKLLQYRALDGDKSDNLPGLYRFPRKKIASLVNDYGDVESIYTAGELNLTEFQQTTLDDFEAQAQLNLEVMRLRTIQDYDLQEGEHDEDTINRLCDDLEFGALRQDLLAFNAKSGFLKTGTADGDSFYTTFGPSGTG